MTRPTTTLVDEVRSLLGETSWAWELRRGGGAKPTHVARHIVLPALRARWTSGRAPRARDVLSPQDIAEVRAQFAAAEPIWRMAVEAQLRIVSAVSTRLADRGTAVTPAELSERTATLVGRHLGTNSDAALDETAIVAALVAERTARVHPLGRDEFFAHYQAQYLAAWARQGAASVASHPPSAICLGHDRRPPTVGVHGDGGWTHGTDRSVHERYRWHVDQRAQPRRERTRPPVDDPHAPAREEIERCCQVYGLADPVHRAVLASLAALHVDDRGTAYAARGRWLLWLEQARPIECTRDGTDRDLTLAASAKLRVWSTQSIGRSLAWSYGPLTSFDDLICQAVVRRVWQSLHGHERTQLDSAGSREVNGWLCTALDVAVPEVLARLGVGASDDPDVRRVDATCELVISAPDMAPRLSRHRDPAVRAAYDHLAQARFGTGWADIVLTYDEFVARFAGVLAAREVGHG